MRVQCRSGRAYHPDAFPAEITHPKKISRFEAKKSLKTKKTMTKCTKIGGHFCPRTPEFRSNWSKRQMPLQGKDPESQFLYELRADSSVAEIPSNTASDEGFLRNAVADAETGRFLPTPVGADYRSPCQGAEEGANPKRLKGSKSGLDELLKTKGQTKKMLKTKVGLDELLKTKGKKSGLDELMKIKELCVFCTGMQ